MHRIAAFRKPLSSIFVPLVLFTCAELALRLAPVRFDGPRWTMLFIDPDRGWAESGRLYSPSGSLFWRLKAGSTDAGEKFRINRAGYRGAEFPAENGEQQVRIVCMGDSSTFGYELPLAETYPVKLQQLLNQYALGKFLVINAGVPGYSSFQGKIDLEERILDLHPQVVTFYYGQNDSEAAMFYDDAEQARMAGSRLRTSLSSLRTYQALHALLQPVARKVRSAFAIGQRKAKVRVHTGQYAANLRTMIEISRSAGVMPVLLTYPYPSAAQNPHTESYVTAVRRTAKETGTVLLDLAADFSGQDSLFHDACHPNDQGNSRIAECIRDALADRY